MAPSASKREVILEYLRETLFPTVKTGASFNYTIKTIERGHRNPHTMGENEFPALFITTSRESRENITGNQFKSNLQVVLVGYVKDSKGNPNADGTGVQKDLDKFIQDVTKAVETDRLQGDRVLWTEITDVATDDGDLMPVAGCVIAVNFQYVTEGVTP